MRRPTRTLVLAAGTLAAVLAGTALADARLDARLDYLRALHQELRAGDRALPLPTEADIASPGGPGRLAPPLAAQDAFAGSLRFHATPGAADFAALAALGVEFFDFGQGPAGSRTVYPAHIPFEALPALAEYSGLAAIECSWRPGAPPPLAQSRPQVEAEMAWLVDDPNGEPLSGDGVVVCDLDTGVLYYHPAFFQLDGQQFNWLDVDGSGDLSVGDAVDLDANGLPGTDEDLRYHEASQTSAYGNGPGYDSDFDFLYNDANSNGSRDYGPPQFGELDPCYGEIYFLTDDTNDNGELDAGEQLLSLGTSKIRAIYNRNGNIYHRGVDLLQSEADYWGHGTQVTGIMGGGWPWRNAMSGMAPGAEFLHSNNDYYAEPPFLAPIEARLAWAQVEGAHVVIIEDGEWIWEFMDGSSNTEILLNELAEDGMIVVVPAGNLATGHMHTSFPGADGITLNNVGTTVIWISFLWEPAAAPATLTMTPPGGNPILVPEDGSTYAGQGLRVYGLKTQSDRGTFRHDLRIATNPEGSDIGPGPLAFAFTGIPGITVHGYFLDDISGWSSPNSWSVLDESHTVTWPATADSAISVTAYSPAGDGDLNGYSGWGPRIDGRRAVDIAAPGSTVYSTHPSTPGNYTPFGGTSGAGPHVAGAAALLKQLIPDLDNGLCRLLLWRGAGQDQYTDDPSRWGAGKLRIFGAIEAGITEVADRPRHPELALGAFPNPFNPATTLRFNLPEAGPATLRIFTANGRQVWSRRLAAGDAGWREVNWDGKDGRGRSLASGIYFAHLLQGDRYAAVRVTLLK